MECEVCMLAFDMEQHRPKVMSCGHTLCWACIQITGKCHMDRQAVPDVNALVDNFYIVSFIEAKKTLAASSRRFYCLTCKAVAKPACEDDHDISSLKKVRQEQVTPHMHTVRLGVELQERIVTRLLTLLPLVAESLNGMVETANERKDALQHALERVENLAKTSGDEEAWLDATQTLCDTAARCAQQRPGLERLLAILEHRGTCQLGLDLDMDGGADAGAPTEEAAEGRRLVAASETELVSDTAVTRALRLIMYLLSISGNLVVHEDDAQTQKGARGVLLGTGSDDGNQSRTHVDELSGDTPLAVRPLTFMRPQTVPKNVATTERASSTSGPSLTNPSTVLPLGVAFVHKEQKKAISVESASASGAPKQSALVFEAPKHSISVQSASISGTQKQSTSVQSASVSGAPKQSALVYEAPKLSISVQTFPISGTQKQSTSVQSASVSRPPKKSSFGVGARTQSIPVYGSPETSLFGFREPTLITVNGLSSYRYL